MAPSELASLRALFSKSLSSITFLTCFIEVFIGFLKLINKGYIFSPYPFPFLFIADAHIPLTLWTLNLFLEISNVLNILGLSW